MCCGTCGEYWQALAPLLLLLLLLLPAAAAFAAAIGASALHRCLWFSNQL
jgi:hypothetical protein